VRELKNVIERSFALYSGPVLGADEVAITMHASKPAADKRKTLAEIEADYIRETLDACQGNQVAAARRLDISRSTLRRKLQDMGVLAVADSDPAL